MLKISGVRLKAESFKVRIIKKFRTWAEWAVYPRDFLIKLENTFLGIPIDEKEEDVDGVPLSDKQFERKIQASIFFNFLYFSIVCFFTQ